MKEMLVSAIVLNYNGAHLLPDCLRSLKEQSYSSMELLVVDNASTDCSRDVAEAHGVPFASTGRNAGLSVASNLAARQVRGDLIFFVNVDTRIHRECLARLAARFDGDDTLFAADPLQYDWGGVKIVHGCTSLRRASLLRTVFPGLRPDYLAPYDGDAEVPWGCAGSIMVRGDRFKALGGFDPTFFLDFEDADLCWRAWRLGWRTIFVPSATLCHKVGHADETRATARPKPVVGSRRQLSSRKNAQRFALKAFEPWRAAMVVTMFALKAAREAARRESSLASLTLRSLALNAREWREILELRRQLDRQSVVSTSSLIEKFTGAT